MLFKFIVVVLFIGNIIALGSALFTLMVDQGRGGRRTANFLLLRVSLAALLLIVVSIGIITGQIGVGTPFTGT